MPTPSTVPAALRLAKGKKMEMEPESRAASSEPSSWKHDSKTKAKEPMLEEEEEEELMAEDTGSSEGDAESEEEPSTPPPELAARMRLYSTDRKKPPPIYKSLVAPKRSLKTPGKEGSSQKKPKGK